MYVLLVLRLSWFQEILKGSDTCPTPEDINEWIKMYNMEYNILLIIHFLGILIDTMMNWKF